MKTRHKRRILGLFLLIPMLIALLLGGCADNKKAAINIKDNYSTFEIESCQYLLSKSPQGDYGWVMSHKGNCNNPIHNCK